MTVHENAYFGLTVSETQLVHPDGEREDPRQRVLELVAEKAHETDENAAEVLKVIRGILAGAEAAGVFRMTKKNVGLALAATLALHPEGPRNPMLNVHLEDGEACLDIADVEGLAFALLTWLERVRPLVGANDEVVRCAMRICEHTNGIDEVERELRYLVGIERARCARVVDAARVEAADLRMLAHRIRSGWPRAGGDPS